MNNKKLLHEMLQNVHGLPNFEELLVRLALEYG